MQEKKRITLFMEQMGWVLGASIQGMSKEEDHMKSLKILRGYENTRTSKSPRVFEGPRRQEIGIIL